MDEAAADAIERELERDAEGQPARPWWRWVDAGELVVALLLTSAALFVRLAFANHAGGLWRDEANSATMASLPFSQTWALLEFDSFPILWLTIERLWIAAGYGSDRGLRVLGMICSMLLPLALWSAARVHGARPTLSMVLVGLSPALVQWGGSNRAYGLGAALLVLLYARVWRAVTTPAAWNWIVAAVVAVLAVQTLFTNAVMVLALCCAAAVVGARRGAWKGTVVPALLVGWAAAISLLPYVPMMRRKAEWTILIETATGVESIVSRLSAALAPRDKWVLWSWAGLLGLSVVCAIVAVFRRSVDAEHDDESNASQAVPLDRDAAMFVVVALLVGLGAHLAFLLRLRYTTYPWYFITPMALAAVSIDAGIASAIARNWIIRGAIAVAAGVLAMVMLPDTVKLVSIRQTNMDLVAAHLRKRAAAEDLVIVDPWYLGMSYARYDAGPAPWTSMPPMPRPHVHRHDLSKRWMTDPAAIDQLLASVESTLRRGHRVWVVGELLPLGTEPPAPLPPAPLPKTGWSEGPYIQNRTRMLTHLLHERANILTMQRIDPGGRVSEYERPPLYRAEGWRP